MQKNVPEIKWLIVLLEKEVKIRKKYFRSEKEEIEQSEVICGGGLLWIQLEWFYMEYVTPLDVDLTSLEHYPSIEISKNDLQ